MNDDSSSLVQFHKRHIFGTAPKIPVKDKVMLLSILTKSVTSTTIFPENLSKIYITTFTLKHMYDKRPAGEYDFIIRNLIYIAKYPSRIYKNHPGKRGHWLLTKNFGGTLYVCSIELINLDPNDGEGTRLCVVSSFKTDLNYLKKYELLWSWKGDNPSS
jgi:hypothetical protein